ncbi:Olfactory Receptor 5B12 [Manis pentadactyla]|nr:Olfactory Receptor 5B12 [Manis pentadactyla]
MKEWERFEENVYYKESPLWREGVDGYNLTPVTHFILMGLSDLPEVHYPLFVLFAITYQVTLVGIGAILLAIWMEKKLHTPSLFPGGPGGTEVFLLAVMAYDLYVAICFPLHYTLIMTKARFAQLAPVTWAAGFLHSLLHTVSTFHLSFCKSNWVNQYYCDEPPVVSLSCSSTYMAEMLVLVSGGVSGIRAFLTTFISYIYIISTILKI